MFSSVLPLQVSKATDGKCRFIFRGKKRYGELINSALIGLYLKWKEANLGLEINIQSQIEHYYTFDMVIASHGAGKTLELIDRYIPLNRYESIFILDDSAHDVWCMEYVSRIRPLPQFVLIKPKEYIPWNWNTQFIQRMDQLGRSTVNHMISNSLSVDGFCDAFIVFLESHVTGNHTNGVKRYEKALEVYSGNKSIAAGHPFPWWVWNY